MGHLKYFLFFTSFVACHHTPHLPSFFDLRWTISNSSEAFKISLQLQNNPSDSSTGLLSVQRLSENVLDYREQNIVRRNMLDTIKLPIEEYRLFLALTQKLQSKDRLQEIEGQGGGSYYSFEIRESRGVRSFSWVGKPKDEDMQTFGEVCEGCFHEKFPEVPCLEADGSIEWKLNDRIKKPRDSHHKRIVKKGMKIYLQEGRDSQFTPILTDDYIELCRVLENNHVWQLASNTEFAIKYPQEYEVTIQRGDSSHFFRVFAPSRLTDRRYFNILNAMESVAAFPVEL